MGKVWYKYEYFWRRGDNDGDESPQDRGDGTGDLIFNTLTKILIDRDYSEWAVNAFHVCADLLIERKRYPDEFLIGKETPNMIVYWWKRYIRKEWPLKPQGRMSRDPFIILGTTYAFFMLNIQDADVKEELTEKFLRVKIPLHLQYSFETMDWWRKLKKDDRQHYVIRLSYFKALGTQFTFERKYENDFYESQES
jgi:hypothetical protein